MALTVLFEDQDLLVVDKPTGLLVHPSREANDKDTLLRRAREYAGVWVYAINRIDRAASGIVVFAKSQEAAALWQSSWHQEGTVKKYLVLLHGLLAEAVVSDRCLTDDRGLQQPARTTFVPIAFAAEKQVTLAETSISSGRRHQIRRHAAHLGHHVLGDRKYGKAKWNNSLRDEVGLERMFLHASFLSITSSEKQALRVIASLAIDLRPCLKLLGLEDAWHLWEERLCIL